MGGALEADYQAALDPGTEGAGVGGSLFSGLLATQANPAAIPAGYDALSGAGLTGAQQMTLTTNADFVEAIRREGAFWLSGAGTGGAGSSNPAWGAPGTWRSWAEATGGAGTLNGDPGTGTQNLSMSDWGFAAGLTYEPTANMLIGAAVGGSSSSYSVSALGTSGTAPGVQAGLYALGGGAGGMPWARSPMATTMLFRRATSRFSGLVPPPTAISTRRRSRGVWKAGTCSSPPNST